MSKVIVERDSHGVVWVTLNRQERRNAIDYDVMDELKKVIFETSQNEADKALVITGSGDQAFCSGGDLSVFQSLHTKEEAYRMLSKMGDVLYQLFTLPKPTVALLNGTAVGGGCELATACDFRMAAEHVKFGFVQGKLAITTGWGGGAMLMERLPIDKALTLLMGAQRYSAKEGYELGFIQKISSEGPLKEQCKAWLEEGILAQSSGVLSAYKKNAVAKWEHTNIRYRMFQEIEQCSKLWESQEHHDAVETFLKR